MPTAQATLGLGTLALVAFSLAQRFTDTTGASAALLIAAVMIVLGAFEGVVVGLAQGLVLRAALVSLQLRTWVLATVIGALFAWALGMILSAAMHLHGASESPAPEMSDAFKLAAAALMGALLGVVLALPQWRVLRCHVLRAFCWLPANALAWAAGMPVVFVVAGSVPEHAAVAHIIIVVLATIAVAGAIVGAIHGGVLVWLLRHGAAPAARYNG